VVLSYTASVILVALALLGLWQLIQDLTAWLLRGELGQRPPASLLIIVRNREQEIEGLLRYLLHEITPESFSDIVVVDAGSADLTAPILDRLARDYPVLQVVQAAPDSRPVAEAMPLCRGAVVHVLDLTNRLSFRQFIRVVNSLAKI